MNKKEVESILTTGLELDSKAVREAHKGLEELRLLIDEGERDEALRKVDLFAMRYFSILI